ncbi:hypothetical protein Sjap_004767 [Stephania japonica]|uniref:SH2 domain-containing protein n=1 Tax=Stephania japonica TaxID=461633 RepID=A0AAP0PJE3_9MAGN
MAARAPDSNHHDYSSLKDLRLEIEGRDGGAFVLCFWIYLGRASVASSGTLIRQMHSDAKDDVPFLFLNEEKKLTLFPPLFLLDASLHDAVLQAEGPCASAEIECPQGKWVHVGCQVGKNLVRLHINGSVASEKDLSSSLKKAADTECSSKLTLFGSDGEKGRPKGYVHYVQMLPQDSSVNSHFIKNPPIELLIDSSCVSEIEEGADGVWSIVGGKASCRRNFSLDVILLDALGHSVNKEMEIVASLQYADNGAPVEKPNDAEAPLLTSYDGIEFASSLRPSKLLNGRASFKLKISQLSSKCDNRLFRVRLDSPKTGRYPFLEAYSNPIRCISRSRNTRTSTIIWKKPNASHPLDASLLVDDESPELQQSNVDGQASIPTGHGSKSSPPLKRVKIGSEKLSVRLQEEQTFGRANSHASSANQAGNASAASMEGKTENIEVEEMDTSLSDSESFQARDSAFNKTSYGNRISDLTIFKYCLGGTVERSLLLKEVTTYATDIEIANFAQHIATYTGCSHHRYQIMMAKRLLKEGNYVWDTMSRGDHHVLWSNAVVEIEEQFLKISGCTNRGLIEQDLELLRRISGCREYMIQENFDKLWQWLYPVAFTLSREWISPLFGCTCPKWIEGLLSKEEAESALKSSRGLQESGTFILRFPTSRSWPHPDAGSLIVTYVGADYRIHHRQLCLDYSRSKMEMAQRSLQDLLLAEPNLMRLGRVTRESLSAC